MSAAVNLSEIRLWTHLNYTYPAFMVNQSLQQFEEAVRDGASYTVNYAPLIEGLEGVYVGWCGAYKQSEHVHST